MSSSFILELDTTEPRIEIDMPNRATMTDVIEVFIRADEDLGEYQKLYLVCADGTRYDLVFSKLDERTLFGYLDIQNYKEGIATLYVQVADTVMNKSALESKTVYFGYVPDGLFFTIGIITRKKLIRFVNRIKNVSFVGRFKTIALIEREKDINAVESEKDIRFVNRYKKITITKV